MIQADPIVGFHLIEDEFNKKEWCLPSPLSLDYQLIFSYQSSLKPCMCVNGPFDTEFGIELELWEPVFLAEVVRSPGTFPILGGLTMRNIGPLVGGSVSSDHSIYQVHLYEFCPVGLLFDYLGQSFELIEKKIKEYCSDFFEDMLENHPQNDSSKDKTSNSKKQPDLTKKTKNPTSSSQSTQKLKNSTSSKVVSKKSKLGILQALSRCYKHQPEVIKKRYFSEFDFSHQVVPLSYLITPEMSFLGLHKGKSENLTTCLQDNLYSRAHGKSLDHLYYCSGVSNFIFPLSGHLGYETHPAQAALTSLEKSIFKLHRQSLQTAGQDQENLGSCHNQALCDLVPSYTPPKSQYKFSLIHPEPSEKMTLNWGQGFSKQQLRALDGQCQKESFVFIVYRKRFTCLRFRPTDCF